MSRREQRRSIFSLTIKGKGHEYEEVCNRSEVQDQGSRPVVVDRQRRGIEEGRHGHCTNTCGVDSGRPVSSSEDCEISHRPSSPIRGRRSSQTQRRFLSCPCGRRCNEVAVLASRSPPSRRLTWERFATLSFEGACHGSPCLFHRLAVPLPRHHCGVHLSSLGPRQKHSLGGQH